jgi:glutamine amidotransferase
MCRLFAMSGGRHRVRASFWLLSAPDNLTAQSHRNPDGTGLGAFDHRGQPIVHRQPVPAFQDTEFAREAKHFHSRTFLAHVRFASGTPVSIVNTHPFELGGRLFAHNGVLRGLDLLDEELGEARAYASGETDSERFFALVTREIDRAGGDEQAGIVAAVSWAAANLPIFSLNLILTTREGIWALRYPETHELFVLERPAGGTHGRRHFDGTGLGGKFRIHSPDLLHHPAVVIASEPLDDHPAWRALEAGELVHIGPSLEVRSELVLTNPPVHTLSHDDLHPQEAASQRAHEAV